MARASRAGHPSQEDSMPSLIKADELSSYIEAAVEQAKRFGHGHHGPHPRGGNIVFSVYYVGNELMAEVPQLDLVEEFDRPLTPGPRNSPGQNNP
jgi:hypothetical protein